MIWSRLARALWIEIHKVGVYLKPSIVEVRESLVD